MALSNKINKNKDSIALALIWPFAGLVSSLRHWRNPSAKNAFWIVCAFLGAVFIYCPSGTILGLGIDAGRYVLSLQDMFANVRKFSEVSSHFYDGVTNDVFADTLMFLVSRLTDNGHFFFFILAVIFGFFYSRNVWYILDRLPDKLPKGFWVLIAALLLVCPIWNINGVRMWTAMHIYCYGALPFLIEGDKRRMWWSVVSILVHQSFIFPIILLFVYLIIPRNVKGNPAFLSVMLVIYFLSLTVKVVNIAALNEFLQSFLPSYYDFRINLYIDEDALQRSLETEETRAAYISILSNIGFWAKQILVITSFSCLTKSRQNGTWLMPLFAFALLFSSIGNVVSNIPSGSRYVTIANMFLFPSVIFAMAYFNEDGKYKMVNIVAYCLLAVSLILDIRVGLDFFGIDMVFGNGLTALFTDVDVPIIDYVKMLF